MIIYKTKVKKIMVNMLRFKRSEPILWFIDGMFCVIPVQIVQNAIDNLGLYEKFSSKYTHPIVTITWDQGIPVDSKVGYALLGE